MKIVKMEQQFQIQAPHRLFILLGKTPGHALQPVLTNDLGMSPALRPSQKEPSMAVGPSSASRKAFSQKDIIVPETPLQWNIKSAQTLQFSPTPNKPPAENSNMVLCTPVAQQHQVKEVVPPVLDLSGSLSPTLDWDDSIESFLNVKLNASDGLFTPPTPQNNEEPKDCDVPHAGTGGSPDSPDASKSVAYYNDVSANKTGVASDSVDKLQDKLVNSTLDSVSSNENGSFTATKPPLSRRSTGGKTSKSVKKPAVPNKRRSSFVPPRPLADKEPVLENKDKDDSVKKNEGDLVGNILSAHAKAVKSSQQLLLGNLSQDDSRSLSKPTNGTLFSAFSKLKPARRSGFVPPIKTGGSNLKESQEIPLYDQVVPQITKSVNNTQDKPQQVLFENSGTASHVLVKSDRTVERVILLSESETELNISKHSKERKENEEVSSFKTKTKAAVQSSNRRRSSAVSKVNTMNADESKAASYKSAAESQSELNISSNQRRSRASSTTARKSAVDSSLSSINSADQSVNENPNKSEIPSRSRRRASVAASSSLSDVTLLTPRRSKRVSLIETQDSNKTSCSTIVNTGSKAPLDTINDSFVSLTPLTPRRSKRLSILPSTVEKQPLSENVILDNSSSATDASTIGDKSAAESNVGKSSKAASSRSIDQVVPNTSIVSLSSELTDFHSPADKPKTRRRLSALPPTPGKYWC